MDNSQFPMRLQRLREKRRISRVVASELCGLGHDAFRRYERGEIKLTEIKVKTLMAIADFFDITVEELINEKPPPITSGVFLQEGKRNKGSDII